MSVRQASKQFGVPRTTLSDILKARVPERKRQMGPDPYLTVPGEEKLVLWIKNLVKCGFPPKKYFLLNTIQKIVKDSNFKTPFKHDRPGKKWLKLFLQRHPDLSIRQSEGISKGRAVITEESLRKWFKDLKSYLKENNLEDVLQDSTRIFNGDETAFSLCPNTGKVIGAKGWKNIYEVKMGNERETITVLLVFSASGQIAPPMIVYPYIRPSQELVNSIPEDWVLGRSETGWMKSEVFFEYMANDFNTWLDKNNIKKPILCFVDGHKSHMTMQLSQFCDSNDIILYALPPNCTHIMQPADVSVFKPLKTDWKDTIMKWQVKPENVNTCLTKITFAPLLAETLNNNELKNSIVNGFRKCGLFPFNADAVDYSKCVQNILENLAASSSNEIDKANSLTQDVKHLQAVVQNIAPKLKARGVNTDIIIEEIEKSLSFEKTDSFAESPDEIGQFDTEKTESTSEINIDNAIQIDKLDGLPEIGEFDYKTRNTGEKSIDNAIPIDKLDSSYDKKVTLIFPDGSISEVPVINVLPSNESNLESVPSPTTMLGISIYFSRLITIINILNFSKCLLHESTFYLMYILFLFFDMSFRQKR
ncbi:uncharacterized protein LOC109861344 [Pseudomyrmex gracilis]|uniref:uncharacterized protein LOC109861344 n=1 Tax=Pseudomyrmex gracilis TaxID=219809 RepID=UPI000995D602|nr:uncharacterized protein LOC109861344 [Pseudomyrmex gracilis]